MPMLPLLLALVATPAHAEELRQWETLELQGTLTLHGDPIHAPGIVFKLVLYDDETSGDPVWLERTKKLKVKRGAFTMLAGDRTPLYENEALTQTKPRDLWLEVTLLELEKAPVRDMMGPRMRITEKAPWGFRCGDPVTLAGETYTVSLKCVPGEGEPIPTK